MARSRRRASNWDSPTKNQLIGAVKSGQSVRKAANLVDMPYRTALDLVKKVENTGSTHELPRSGRPALLDEDEKDQIEQIARGNRRMPFKEISNRLDTPVSAATVRRALNERGYRRCVAPRVPFLTPKQKDARLEWALGQSGRERDDGWRNVMWSDECYVVVGSSHRIFVTRKPDEKWDDDCVVPRFKQSSLRAMVWGCCARDYRGGLKILEYPGGKGGGMTAELYRSQVLEDMVLPEFTELKKERPKLQFQQDSAPAHRAKTTKAWFADHDIPLFPHPANSPDVSPQEPLWNVLKSALDGLPRQPTTHQELVSTILEVWESITTDEVNKYVDRMPRIVQAVIDAQGGHTQY
uniref:Transposase Tc1-like domain-containing protein n=1 Tax=Mycena chlorophos TaxID=658473 RepID=A0ABQ0L1Q9_MYCCL|nr:predicted protein [Mycena chlorophos]